MIARTLLVVIVNCESTRKVVLKIYLLLLRISSLFHSLISQKKYPWFCSAKITDIFNADNLKITKYQSFSKLCYRAGIWFLFFIFPQSVHGILWFIAGEQHVMRIIYLSQYRTSSCLSRFSPLSPSFNIRYIFVQYSS